MMQPEEGDHKMDTLEFMYFLLLAASASQYAGTDNTVLDRINMATAYLDDQKIWEISPKSTNGLKSVKVGIGDKTYTISIEECK